MGPPTTDARHASPAAQGAQLAHRSAVAGKHAPAQQTSQEPHDAPAPQLPRHTPRTHDSPGLQARRRKPQLFGSLERSTQPSAGLQTVPARQGTPPTRHTHVPDTQFSPTSHDTVPQRHAPPTQVSPSGHAGPVPQPGAAQLVPLLVVTHAWPLGHGGPSPQAHVVAWLPSGPQRLARSGSHAAPHAPQFAKVPSSRPSPPLTPSTARTHAPHQQVVPSGQAGAHAAASPTAPASVVASGCAPASRGASTHSPAVQA